ncbi:MAG: hypothetical protein FWE88_09350 [Phycisphaerae bacterium]|nr:hypothetical protein [Phycisphaerae bacterium]
MRLFIIAIALACMAQVKLVEDPPLSTPPKAGKITGTISPANNIDEVYAMSRNITKRHKVTSFDARTGNFTFDNMPGDAVYDICVKLKDGRVIEGIDLSFVDSRMIRLAELRRKNLGMPSDESPHEFSMEDAKELVKFGADFSANDFMDMGRVLYVQGHGGRATMLVELIRNREFYESNEAEIIWRIELWYYLWQHGGWERVANQERVLRRVRTVFNDWQKISVEYLPTWNVYVDNNGKSAAAKLQIPAKPDPATGRPARSDPALTTEPNLLGITAEKSAGELKDLKK